MDFNFHANVWLIFFIVNLPLCYLLGSSQWMMPLGKFSSTLLVFVNMFNLVENKFKNFSDRSCNFDELHSLYCVSLQSKQQTNWSYQVSCWQIDKLCLQLSLRNANNNKLCHLRFVSRFCLLIPLSVSYWKCALNLFFFINTYFKVFIDDFNFLSAHVVNCKFVVIFLIKF